MAEGRQAGEAASDTAPAGGTDLVPAASDLAAAALTLARRFAAGGSLWAWSPHAPAHASHVAVEFVHPVIMGKRGLPAVAVTDLDPIEALRPLARAGDILLALAPASDPALTPTLGRVHAWGLATVWLGVGSRPDAGAADHVLLLPGDEALAGHDGTLALGYHLLWELTHVCFEHPGLLAEPEPYNSGGCVTCSDEGRLGEVVDVGRTGTAMVRTPDGTETVDTTVVGSVGTGDLVVIHAGSAISVVDPARE